MQTVLIVIHLLVVIALIATVLLQRSEGGALGMGGGGGGGFFTGRGQANALTRATAILATLFFVTSLSLTILASYNRSQKSIFESPTATAPAAPVSTAPASAPDASGTMFDRVKQTAVDGFTQIEKKIESLTGSKPATPASPAPAAAESTRAAPDAAQQPKGTVLDQLKQMEKNAQPSSPGSGQAPPRAR